LVLYPLWQTSTVLRTGHYNFALTTPSLLSRGTLLSGSGIRELG
jgi:hypothetical protein